jgi:hypothetical protein
MKRQHFHVGVNCFLAVYVLIVAHCALQAAKHDLGPWYQSVKGQSTLSLEVNV